MIAVDTNVWVRYLTNDDPTQAQQALQLLEGVSEVFVPKTVLLEVEWVLRAVYQLQPEVVRQALLQILGLPIVRAEAASQVAMALEYQAQGMDFADALHLAASEPAEAFYTFDAAFVKKGRALGARVMALPTP